METEGKLSLAEVFVSITDPRQAKKVQHDLVELLVVAVNAVLVGADTFVEIELWARERLDWLRSYLRLKHGIPSHDTFGRLFGLIDPGEFESAFRRWVSSILPVMGLDTVMPRGRRFPEPAVPYMAPAILCHRQAITQPPFLQRGAHNCRITPKAFCIQDFIGELGRVACDKMPVYKEILDGIHPIVGSWAGGDARRVD